jgi:hypothetical protein
MSQKYIKVKRFNGIENVVILFSSIIDHKKFTQSLGLSKEDIKSSGFADITISDMRNPIYKCRGESLSLGLKSDPIEDSKELNYQLYESYDTESY